MSLGALNERLESKLKQQREEIEALAKNELKNLSNSLSASSKDALSTTEAVIQQKCTELTKSYQIALTDLTNSTLRLNGLFLRAWMRNLLIGLGIVVGLSLGTWGVFRYQNNRLHNLQHQVAVLEKQKIRLEQTVSILEGKTWGITLIERSEGRFVSLPKGSTLKSGWTLGDSPTWKME